jgi:hypothetical protein
MVDSCDIQTIETAIIDRLKAKLTDAAIEPFPDRPAEYQLIHSKGALLVSFSGSVFSEPEATDVIVQDRRMEFDVTVVTKSLRASGAHHGAYALLEAARLTLTGHQIPGCGKISPRREGFLSEKAGTWQYGIRFAMSTKAVEDGENEEVILLKQVTVQDNFGETEVIP